MSRLKPAILGVAAAVGPLQHPASAQVPGHDAVDAAGGNSTLRFEIHVSGGPSGEQPTGSATVIVTVFVPPETFTSTAIRCLEDDR